MNPNAPDKVYPAIKGPAYIHLEDALIGVIVEHIRWNDQWNNRRDGEPIEYAELVARYVRHDLAVGHEVDYYEVIADEYARGLIDAPEHIALDDQPAAKAIGDAVAQNLDRHNWDVQGIGRDVHRALEVKGVGVYAV